MQPVECLTCGNQVLCEKFSLAHTSVQWTTDAAVACAEIRAQVADGASSALVRTCGPLRASIEQAVAAGELAVLDA
ncbi:hypothetical protein [Streptomyces sp. Da 82-17]|uniref:hypothetical protein n=1 Tax=Streptomyces sp. Da 82-17 TaxID=3377116 RepID=UPI0038D419B5